jgi:hypothetical protein
MEQVSEFKYRPTKHPISDHRRDLEMKLKSYSRINNIIRDLRITYYNKQK